MKALAYTCLTIGLIGWLMGLAALIFGHTLLIFLLFLGNSACFAVNIYFSLQMLEMSRDGLRDS